MHSRRAVDDLSRAADESIALKRALNLGALGRTMHCGGRSARGAMGYLRLRVGIANGWCARRNGCRDANADDDHAAQAVQSRGPLDTIAESERVAAVARRTGFAASSVEAQDTVAQSETRRRGWERDLSRGVPPRGRARAASRLAELA